MWNVREKTGWQNFAELNDLEGKDHVDDRLRDRHKVRFLRRLIKLDKQEQPQSIEKEEDPTFPNALKKS